MEAVAHNYLPREDYLAGELISFDRHEYIAGAVYAMSGGTMNHQTVGLNFTAEARNGLRGSSCRTTTSDQLLRVDLKHGEAFFYPDATIICQEVAGDARYIESPVVILEVLSKSTRRSDESVKLISYQQIPSLRVYLLAEQDQPLVKIYRREQAGAPFTVTVLRGIDQVLALPEVSLEIPFSELYRDVTFEEPEPDGSVSVDPLSL